MSLQLCVVVGIPDVIHVDGITVEDGVSLFDVGETPAIVDARGRMSPAYCKTYVVLLTSDRPCLSVEAGCQLHARPTSPIPHSRLTLPSAAPVLAFFASLVSSNTGLSRCSVDMMIL